MAVGESFLTEASLKTLEELTERNVYPLIDILNGLCASNRQDWFDSHRPLAPRLLHIIVLNLSKIDSDVVSRVSNLFLVHHWYSGITEDSVILLGSKLSIVRSFKEETQKVFEAYLKLGKIEGDISPDYFNDIATLGKTLENKNFYVAFQVYFYDYLIKRESGFEHLHVFNDPFISQTALMHYFSSKGVESYFKNKKWLFPFSGLGFLTPAILRYAAQFLNVLWIDEKANPAEVGAFYIAHAILKNLTEIEVNGYSEDVSPILKNLQNLKTIRFVNISPTHKVLCDVFSSCRNLESLEFEYSDQRKYLDSTVEVSSVLYDYLQKLKVNFAYRKISSVNA